jgi:hypothetical protein
MTIQNDRRREMARNLDAMTGDLQSALAAMDAEISEMEPARMFDALAFAEKFGDVRDEHHRILLEKLRYANAAEAARGNQPLDIHLKRPDDFYRLRWHLTVMDGHVVVMDSEFASFKQGKAAFDALAEFIRIAGREGELTFEPPAQTDADPVPF